MATLLKYRLELGGWSGLSLRLSCPQNAGTAGASSVIVRPTCTRTDFGCTIAETVVQLESRLILLGRWEHYCLCCNQFDSLLIQRKIQLFALRAARGSIMSMLGVHKCGMIKQ